MSSIPYVTYNREFQPRRAATPQTHQAYTFPSPMGGVNVQQQLAGGDPLTAVQLENLLPAVQGVVLRDGYTRWQGGLAAPAKTIMGYVPSKVALPDKVFAACNDGKVYDITTQEQTPPLAPVLTLVGQTDPGNFSFINFTNEFGNPFLLAVSPGGGYVTWNGTAWATVTMGAGATQIQNVDPRDFSYIWEWGNKVWFVQRDTLDVWYLPTGQIYGNAKKFPLGSVCPHGGSMYAGVNWTVDGGGGDSGSTTSMSDKIVFVTDQGDVVIYSGSDPDTASTFKIDGRWFIGRLPVGGRAVRRYGSDVMIVSERGLVFLSELLRGQGFFSNAELARNVNPILSRQVSLTLDVPYWELQFSPREQMIIVNYPRDPSSPDRQWAYMINTKAFTLLRGMDMQTVGVAMGRTLFADADGNVWWAFEGESDGVVGSVRGKDIEGLMVTTFQPMGDGVRQKRCLMCKTQLYAPSAPGVNQELHANFDAQAPAAPLFTMANSSRWDVALWDGSYWAGGQQGFTVWKGAVGMGYYVAMTLRVKGAPGTTVVNWCAVVENGGLLGV